MTSIAAMGEVLPPGSARPIAASLLADHARIVVLLGQARQGR